MNQIFYYIFRSGDVDLYISLNSYPTYHLNNHDYSSCSCGEEIFAVDDEFVQIYLLLPKYFINFFFL